MPAPRHISYSQISTFLQCPKRYELEKVIRVPTAPAVYFAGGSAVHRTTEILDKEVVAPSSDAVGDPANNTGAGSLGEAEMPVLQHSGTGHNAEADGGE